jgi:Tfp pilus assembly major pilin PilA
LEEVSGFVVVTKQNYFKPIRKKQQNQKQQQRSSEQEIYCFEDQKDADHYNQQMKGASRFYLDSRETNGDPETELSEYESEQNLPKSLDISSQRSDGFTDKSIGISVGDKIQLPDICDEKENETVLVRANEIYNSDSGRPNVECQVSEVLPEKSQAVQNLSHRNSFGDKRRDECNHKQGMKMQTIAEGCVEKFISSMQKSPVSSPRGKIYANNYVTQPYVRTLDSISEVKKRDKIEAIEGWMKIYESEFFSERNKTIDNEITNTPVKEAMERDATMSIQEPHNLISHPTILLGNSEKTVEPAEIQTSTNFFHSYVDVIGAKEREYLAQRIPECSGSHPRIEGTKKSPSTKLSQEGLDFLKYFSAETLDEKQLNLQNYGNTDKKELPVPKTLARICHSEGQPIPPKGIQEFFCGPNQNLNTENNFSENSSLMTSNNSKGMNCPMQSKNTKVEDISIEPTCEAVRVTYQQSNSFQFKARLGVQKRPTEVGNKATLEEIEAMIEPKTEEQPSMEQTSKKKEERNAVVNREQLRTNCRSLMPDIVKVKLGIDNQSKILDRLDLMMKHNEITNRNTYKTNDTKAALFQCSETLTSLHKSDSGIGKTDLISCRPCSFPSSFLHSKNVDDFQTSGIYETKKSHTQCNVKSDCNDVSGMSDEKIIQHCLQVSPQCSSLQKFPVEQNEGSEYHIQTGHPKGE